MLSCVRKWQRGAVDVAMHVRHGGAVCAPESGVWTMPKGTEHCTAPVEVGGDEVVLVGHAGEPPQLPGLVQALGAVGPRVDLLKGHQIGTNFLYHGNDAIRSDQPINAPTFVDVI